MQTRVIHVAVRRDGTISVGLPYWENEETPPFGTTDAFKAGAEVERLIYRLQKEMGVEERRR